MAGPGGRLPRRAVVGYALGSLGSGGYNSLPGLVLAYYLTDSLGVAASLAAVVTVVPKLWDAVIDPVIGRRSDHAARRSGTRAPYLLAGGLTMPLAFAAMFLVPAGTPPGWAAVWVLLAYLLAATCFSLFQVPWLALSAEITTSPRERTRMMSWRVAVLAVALLLFGGAGPALRDAVGEQGYLVLGITGGLVIGVGILSAWWGVRDVPRLTDHEPAPGWRTQLAAVRQHTPFRALLTAFTLQALATGAQLAAAQYVATYLLDDSTAVSVIFACFIVPQGLAMPWWSRTTHRIGKRAAYRLASLVYLGGAVILLSAMVAPPVVVFLASAVSGVGYAGLQLLPLSMLPDATAAAETADRRSLAGLFAGVWAAAETAALALGPGVVLGLLAVTGFVATTAEEVATQPDSALLGILLAFSAVPAGLLVASLPFVRRYDLAVEEP